MSLQFLNRLPFSREEDKNTLSHRSKREEASTFRAPSCHQLCSVELQ